MSILIAPIPLFDSNMEVKEYLLSSQSGEKLLGTRDNFLKMDEAFSHAGLDMVE